MIAETRRVDAGGERLFCRFDRPGTGTAPSVLMLHGGGPAAGEQYQYLAEAFVAAGQGVVRFDHSGQGQSSGRLAASSLARRTAEAEAVLAAFGFVPEVLVASSMGGAVAADLVSRRPPRRLVLFCPAAYAKDAWTLRFDGGFTDRIRTPESWRSSDLPAQVAGYRGEVLLVWGDRDEVIPPGVAALWDEALAGAGPRRRLVLEGCPHPIHRWAAEQAEARRRIVEAVTGRTPGR